MLFNSAKNLFSSADVKAFTPPQITPRAAERSRRLAARRAPFLMIGDLRLGLDAVSNVEEWSELGQPVELVFSIGGEQAYIHTVAPLLQRIMSYAEVMLSPKEMDAELMAFLLENTLIEGITQLEAALNSEVNFLRIAKPEQRKNLADLSFNVAHGESGMTFPGLLYASAPTLALIAREWEQQPLIASDPPELTASLCSRAALIDLPLRAVRQLAVGDAMLFDRIALAGGAVVTLQERIHAAAQFDEEGRLILTEPFSHGGHHNFGDFLMDEEEGERLDALSESQIEDLPVRLIFEIGRTELTVEDLRALSVGSPVPLGKSTSSAVDIIANGRKIGAGEMVMIGDQLGVRVTRLVGHA